MEKRKKDLKYVYIILAGLAIGASCLAISMRNKKINIVEVGYSSAQQHYKRMLVGITPGDYPRTMNDEGKLMTTPMNDWTEGFFPGSLWYLYEHTNDNYWKEQATEWTETLEPMKYTRHHHDVGFIIYCSFGNGYRLTKNERYKDILVEAANSLCSRYSDKVGSIESWDYRKSWNGRDEWFYPVIIDNMMNLELLYFASKVTGNTEYAKIANKHAETTLKNQFREDFSTYHVVNYDPETGAVLHKTTCQGFSDNSAWARGQAWAIYSFTMVYRETKNPLFLEAAVKSAEYWLNHPNMPQDLVPYWDFNAGQEGYIPDWDYNPADFKVVPRDASAAAIAASGFLELADYVEDGKKYITAAEKTLESLTSSHYLAEIGTNADFVIKHCVGSLPHNSEVDKPLVYADYYYLEALNRYQQYQNTTEINY